MIVLAIALLPHQNCPYIECPYKEKLLWQAYLADKRYQAALVCMQKGGDSSTVAAIPSVQDRSPTSKRFIDDMLERVRTAQQQMLSLSRVRTLC